MHAISFALEIGSCLAQQRKFDEAGVLFFNVTRAMGAGLGWYSEQTLRALKSATFAFVMAREYESAFELFPDLVKGQRRVFGATHPETLRSVMMFSILLEEHFKYYGLCVHYLKPVIERFKTHPDYDMLKGKLAIATAHLGHCAACGLEEAPAACPCGIDRYCDALSTWY